MQNPDGVAPVVVQPVASRSRFSLGTLIPVSCHTAPLAQTIAGTPLFEKVPVTLVPAVPVRSGSRRSSSWVAVDEDSD